MERFISISLEMEVKQQRTQVCSQKGNFFYRINQAGGGDLKRATGEG